MIPLELRGDQPMETLQQKWWHNETGATQWRDVPYSN